MSQVVHHTWRDTVPTSAKGRAYKGSRCIGCGCARLRHLQTFKTWFHPKGSEAGLWWAKAPECVPNEEEMRRAKGHWDRINATRIAGEGGE